MAKQLRRCKLAAEALKAFAEASKLDQVETAQPYTVTDLMTNLLHYANSRGFNAMSILRSTEVHYRAEREVRRHPHVNVGHCDYCGHFGEDCTGVRTLEAVK